MGNTREVPKYKLENCSKKLQLKKSIVSLKSQIYSKRAQNRHYNLLKESLDHGQILVHLDYPESYKSSQQNEIQSAYFGNTIFKIFTACCYTKPLDDDGDLKKDSIIVISEDKDHDRAAAITCVKKVIEKAKEINPASYDKIYIWSDGCSAQFRARFVFCLLTENLFDNAELIWNYNQKKSHGKGPMVGVDGTVKNIIFRKVKLGFVTINTPLEFRQAVLKFVPSIHSVYLADADVLSKSENTEQESKKIPETLTIHDIERFQMKGVYALKFFHLAEDEQPFYTQWYANGKDVMICRHESSEFDDNHCASCHEE